MQLRIDDGLIRVECFNARIDEMLQYGLMIRVECFNANGLIRVECFNAITD